MCEVCGLRADESACKHIFAAIWNVLGFNAFFITPPPYSSTNATIPRDTIHMLGLCRHVVSVRLSVCHVRVFC